MRYCKKFTSAAIRADCICSQFQLQSNQTCTHERHCVAQSTKTGENGKHYGNKIWILKVTTISLTAKMTVALMLPERGKIQECKYGVT